MLKTDAILADNRRGPTAATNLILQRQGDVAVKVAHQEGLAVPSAQVRALEDQFATESLNSRRRFSTDRTPLKPDRLRELSWKLSGSQSSHRKQTWEPLPSRDQAGTLTSVPCATTGAALGSVHRLRSASSGRPDSKDRLSTFRN